IMDYLAPMPGDPASIIRGAASNALEAQIREMALNEIYNSNADYRNLINEYRDGILLYEISNSKVWDRAAKDTEGLQAFFKTNADKYKWPAPKFKSYIFFADSDSILAEALAYAENLGDVSPATLSQELRKKFGRNVKAERVIAAKGENLITDYLAFGGDKPSADAKTKWKAYAAFHGRVIEAPEEAADVRGAAVTDYQAKLEKEWLDQLHKEYKVKINQKVLNKLRSK
ncbi:MAG: hypothetical protein K2F79_09120, partial [Muribaculaceae bacterium]|nr:hypothetical protein [Muribaculaceae bacterium]